MKSCAYPGLTLLWDNQKQHIEVFRADLKGRPAQVPGLPRAQKGRSQELGERFENPPGLRTTAHGKWGWQQPAYLIACKNVPSSKSIFLSEFK